MSSLDAILKQYEEGQSDNNTPKVSISKRRKT